MRSGLLRLVSASVAAGALLLGTSSAFAVDQVVSVSIVDAPRPQPKWGYAPGTQKIDPGTWVTWSNDGGDPHTVTATDGSFDSGNLDPSEGFSWFFDQPGTFIYECALHPWMKGKIVVGDGVAVQTEPPASPTDQSAEPTDQPADPNQATPDSA